MEFCQSGNVGTLDCPAKGGGDPSPVLVGGGCTPVQSWLGQDGATPTWDWFTPCLGLGGTPRRDHGPVTGVPPQKGHGTSGSVMAWRWVPPPLRCAQIDTCESSTFSILRMRVVTSSQPSLRPALFYSVNMSLSEHDTN